VPSLVFLFSDGPARTSTASCDDVVDADCRAKAQNSVALISSPSFLSAPRRPWPGRCRAIKLVLFATNTPPGGAAFVKRDLGLYCPQGSRTPRRISPDCVEKRDGRTGVAQGRSGNLG
jgi:hypothetical protein